MIEALRRLVWRFLGIKFYNYLKYKNQINLKDAPWVNLGKHSYDNGAYVWRWYKDSKLEIGKYCSIANDVNFICDSGYHTESEVTSFPMFHELLTKEDVVILRDRTYKVRDIKEHLKPQKAGIVVGNDVWIGHGATILPGVVIGNGVTVLAGAIVSSNIPDYAIVGGVPAKILKIKHDDELVVKLTAISWWNWSDELMKNRVNDFYLPVNKFVEKYYS